jgi:hypothetical protein
MKSFKLGLLTSTICILITLPIILFGVKVPYINAYEDTSIPNISEIVFKFDSQEAKNIYNLNLVMVVINGNPRYVLTNRIDVNRLLEDMGVVLDNNKKVVSTTEEVQDGTVIRVITVGTVIEELNIEIPFETREVNTKEIPYGSTETVQSGVMGIRTKHVRKTYEDGKLVSEQIISDEVTKSPVAKIIKVGVLRYSPADLAVRYGYNCDHWYSVVDEGNYTDQEKQWLKLVMYCESGCNAESEKHSVYKGLFQWNPRYWDAYYYEDNIFDGYAQIENTVHKIRQGVSLSSYWPACHKRYVQQYGEFIR